MCILCVLIRNNHALSGNNYPAATMTLMNACLSNLAITCGIQHLRQISYSLTLDYYITIAKNGKVAGCLTTHMSSNNIQSGLYECVHCMALVSVHDPRACTKHLCDHLLC